MFLAENFLRSCVNVLLRRSRIFVVFNTLFFDSIFVGVLLSQFFYVPSSSGVLESLGILTWLRGLDWPWMILVIFLFNLVVGGFVVLTLPGLVFFPLSIVFLTMRGILWGIMWNQPFIVPFLLVLPTFLLEGEGYVLTSMAGTILGFSWLKPNWIHKEKNPSRMDALKTALREALRLLFLGAILLLLAAVLETLTITRS